MAALLLNTHSVIFCPHGGVVTHIPSAYTTYRVDGQLPMRQADSYLINGCPNGAYSGMSCTNVQWVSASARLIIKGSPALTLASVGLCMAGGVALGPAVVARSQTGQTEPEAFTVIDD